jgi:predicted nucleic acid-binding protein
MLSDPTWISARHTWVEVRRNLSRLLRAPELFKARDAFTRDWDRVNVVELDETTCAMAADVAELTLARTQDALHLAAVLGA